MSIKAFAELDFTDPRKVDVGRLGRELQGLLRDATHDPDGTDGPIQAPMRVCVSNIIAVAADQQGADMLTPILSELPAKHPSRMIVVVAERDAPQDNLSAWIMAQVHRPTGGRKAVCSDEIVLNASGTCVDDVSYVVAPMLVSDLPTYLWWHAANPFESNLFTQLEPYVTRVILNSSEFSDPAGQLRQLSERITSGSSEIAFNDIGWSRLATWRELISQFFDTTEACEHLSRISRLVVEYEPQSDGGLSPRALYIVGWLASRLGWKMRSAVFRNSKDVHLCAFDHNGRTIAVEMRSSKMGKARLGGLLSVELQCEEEPTATFCISREKQPRGFADTWIEINGKTTIARVLPMDFPTDVALMLKQFSVIGRDPLFEAALERAAELVRG